MKRRTLEPEDIKHLGQAFLSLAKEVWVLRDRQRVLEGVLERHGIPAQEEVNNFVPDEETSKFLEAERSAFIRSLLDALEGTDDNSS